MKEFSDNYKTTIGADFLSMDVTTENDQKVSLQVRTKWKFDRPSFNFTLWPHSDSFCF